MKYILDIPENKASFAEEFFKTISFIKNFKAVLPNEVNNPSLVQSIEDYENGTISPTPLSLDELKKMLDE
jgi:hypothetical protein